MNATQIVQNPGAKIRSTGDVAAKVLETNGVAPAVQQDPQYKQEAIADMFEAANAAEKAAKANRRKDGDTFEAGANGAAKKDPVEDNPLLKSQEQRKAYQEALNILAKEHRLNIGTVKAVEGEVVLDPMTIAEPEQMERPPDELTAPEEVVDGKPADGKSATEKLAEVTGKMGKGNPADAANKPGDKPAKPDDKPADGAAKPVEAAGKPGEAPKA